MLVLLLLGWAGRAGADCSAGLFPCLKADLATALGRAAASESVRLLPGLSLDRKPGVSPLPPPTAAYAEPPSLAQLYSSAERLFDTHSLYWNILPGLDLTVTADQGRHFQLGVARCHHGEERTFRLGMRRMKFMMLPIMYKLGVITTLLTLLTVFALKGLTIGVLLLIMSTAGLVAKFKWSHHGGGYGGYPASGKEVHVHVHGGGHGAPIYHSHPPVHYDDWVREDRYEEQQRPGVVHHHPQPQVVHHTRLAPHHARLPPPESTSSPWASYIGDQAL